MKIKDLRKVLKGVSGEAELCFGNYILEIQ